MICDLELAYPVRGPLPSAPPAVQLVDNQLLLSASDLTNHLACKHLTQLNRGKAEGRMEPPPHRYDDHLELLQERGRRFEQEYVDHLRKSGASVAALHIPEDLTKEERQAASRRAEERTRDAMAKGVDYIIQARLRTGQWMGIADVLRKVRGASSLGDWHYEAIDTKLATETKAATVLQLCLYTQLLEDIQGTRPEEFHVVRPGAGFALESFRFMDFRAYFRLVQRKLGEATSGSPRELYPEPVAHCEQCRWWVRCNGRRRADDHLSFVAGLSRLQAGELERQGIMRLEPWAEREAPLPQSPKRGSRQSFERGHLQAQAQLMARRSGQHYWELIDHEPERGLALLPTPDPGDVFFDIESDNFVDDGGLEYLFGLWFNEDGVWQYRPFWARTHGEERVAFEAVMDLLMDRWMQFPDFHIYHFSPYDKAAMSRLMGRHGTKEVEVDRLLRGKRFVDLMAVMKQGVRAGIETYGLKDIEPLIGFERETPLPDARKALRVVAWDLELGRLESWDDAAAAVVQAYNREDCLATAVLRDWLEARRVELVEREGAIQRPVHTDGVNTDVEDRAGEIQELFDAITSALPVEREDRTPEEQARWLLAHMLEYHRREGKVTHWEKFRLAELDEDQRERDRHAIAGMRCLGEVGRSARNHPIKRYEYPEQDVSVDEGDILYVDADQALGTVKSADPGSRTLDIQHREDAADLEPTSVFAWDFIGTDRLRDSLIDFARSVLSGSLDPEYEACWQLLLAASPRLPASSGGPLRELGEDLLEAANRLASDLDRSVLPIQGPPGTGKTYIGARMIASLRRQGKRVGVTAVSHKVIENLLENVVKADSTVKVAHKRARKDLPEYIQSLGSDKAVIQALDEGLVAGGTVFQWARMEMLGQLDYLFIDEAGQMALANALAAGRAAKNIVLLGDPQQLEQPQKGSHPEGADVATLVHVLGGHDTIPDDRGLFLDETWRLAPTICEFTSDSYYDGRLRSRPEVEGQALRGPNRFSGAGLFHVSVEHAGNQSSSPEEVEVIARICDELLQPGVSWVNQKGKELAMGWQSILIVAPYNDQVGALQRRLPHARVGTVDRFQGQEAPVVIYSMASSSAADAPRGMRFLYSPNRFNVASSRARCVCIVVSAEAVMEPECGTVESMRWANGLAEFGERSGSGNM